jgi:MFS family permease
VQVPLKDGGNITGQKFIAAPVRTSDPLTSSVVLRRGLEDSFPADVREHVTALTLARTTANACFRFAPPFLATIAHGNGTDLAGIGIAVAISELSGLLSPFNGEIVERLHRRAALALGLGGVGLGTMLAASSVHPVMFAIAVLVAQCKVMFDPAWRLDLRSSSVRAARRIIGLTETSWALGLLVGVSSMGLVTAATNWRVGYAVERSPWSRSRPMSRAPSRPTPVLTPRPIAPPAARSPFVPWRR